MSAEQQPIGRGGALETPEAEWAHREQIRQRLSYSGRSRDGSGNGRQVEDWCISVLYRMPEEARECVIANAAILWVDGGLSYVQSLQHLREKLSSASPRSSVSPPSANPPGEEVRLRYSFFMLLAANLPFYAPEVAMGIIAHEFAHTVIFADPDFTWENTDEFRAAHEQDTDDLARSWGFAEEIEASRRSLRGIPRGRRRNARRGHDRGLPRRRTTGEDRYGEAAVPAGDGEAT